MAIRILACPKVAKYEIGIESVHFHLVHVVAQSSQTDHRGHRSFFMSVLLKVMFLLAGPVCHEALPRRKPPHFCVENLSWGSKEGRCRLSRDFLQWQTWGGGFVMETAIFTKLCVSLKFIPTNEPTNQLIHLQISTLDFIQGFIGMRTSSAPNFLSPKTSGRFASSSGTGLMTRHLMVFVHFLT